MIRLLALYSPALVLLMGALMQLIGWYVQGMGLLALAIAVALHIRMVVHK